MGGDAGGDLGGTFGIGGDVDGGAGAWIGLGGLGIGWGGLGVEGRRRHDGRIGLGSDLTAEQGDVVIEDIDALEEEGVGPADIIEFELLLVAEHAFAVAPGEIDLGIADAIGGGLVVIGTAVLEAADLEVTVVMVKGEDLVGEAGLVEVAEGEMGVEILGIDLEGPVEAFAGIEPASLVEPAEAVLEIAFAAGITGGPGEPVATGDEGEKKATAGETKDRHRKRRTG